MPDYRRLLRAAPDEATHVVSAIDPRTLAEITVYLDGADGAGTTDRDLLKDKLKRRYATGIKPRSATASDGSVEDTGWEEFEIGNVSQAIDADLS